MDFGWVLANGKKRCCHKIGTLQLQHAIAAGYQAKRRVGKV